MSSSEASCTFQLLFPDRVACSETKGVQQCLVELLSRFPGDLACVEIFSSLSRLPTLTVMRLRAFIDFFLGQAIVQARNRAI